jgi:SAM-dependent methyltransferase
MDEREHHDEFYAHEAAAIFDAPWFLEVRRKLAALLAQHGRQTSGDRVLSLGCGDGRVECLLARRVKEIVGIELSPVAVEQAQARAAGAGFTNLRFEVGDIEHLDLPRASFDAIWMLGVLHHVGETETAELLRRCLSILRPGGLMVSNDPSARRLIGWLKGLVAKQYNKYHSPDERELDPRRLATLYADAGFEDVAIHYNDFFLGPFSWLFPTAPKVLVRPLSALDSLLLAIPVVRNTASEFLAVGRKPLS